MSRASGQASLGAHRFTGTATGARARMSAAWSGAPLQAASRLRLQGAAWHLLERPSLARAFPAGEPCQRKQEPHAGPIRR